MNDMKKIFVAILAAAALLLAGCAKTENSAPAVSRTVRVSVGVDATISKVVSSTTGRFTWKAGDEIGIWTGNGITKFTLDPEWDNFGYGEFVGELPEGGVINENSYAIYPYAEGAEATATSYTFPAASKWEIPAANYMLYGNGAQEKDGKYTFTFHHTTAYFRVKVTNIRQAATHLFIESAGPCFALGATLDFSAATPAITYAEDENLIYALPEHSGATDATLIIPIAVDTFAQQWGKGGLKLRIVTTDVGGWWGTPFDDAAGFLGEGVGFTTAAGEYYIFPEIKCANAKNADDSGTGVNDGIEDSNVIIQDPNDFWTVSLN
jgi:hypothetical protein